MESIRNNFPLSIIRSREKKKEEERKKECWLTFGFPADITSDGAGTSARSKSFVFRSPNQENLLRSSLSTAHNQPSSLERIC